MIRNGLEFDVVNEQVKKLVVPPLTKDAQGQNLTPEEVKKVVSALPMLSQMRQYDPTNLNIYSLQGKVLRVAGKQEESFKAFKDGIALALQPRTEEDRWVRADVLGEIGRHHYRLSQLLESIQALEAAIQLDPNSAELRALLGRSYWYAGDKTKAEQNAVDALAFDSQNTNARTLLNMVLKGRQAPE
jgi:predicted Zn-dependent protease